MQGRKKTKINFTTTRSHGVREKVPEVPDGEISELQGEEKKRPPLPQLLINQEEAIFSIALALEALEPA